MSSSKVDTAGARREGRALRIVGFGLLGGCALAVAGVIEGIVAFYVFRAIAVSLYPENGVWVMTALSSQLPLVLAVAGLLVGAIGMACFGGGHRAQESVKWTLITLLRNSLIGATLGVLVGGMSALALGRTQSQQLITLFSTFFAGVFVGFLLGLIVSLLLSAKRKPTAA